jgi:hypothetical protein
VDDFACVASQIQILYFALIFFQSQALWFHILSAKFGRSTYLVIIRQAEMTSRQNTLPRSNHTTIARAILPS